MTKFKPQKGDYFEVSKLTQEQYDELCEVYYPHCNKMFYGKLPGLKSYVGWDYYVGFDFWDDAKYFGPNARLLTYNEVFPNDIKMNTTAEFTENNDEDNMELMTPETKVKVTGMMGESYKARILVNDGGDPQYPYIVEYFNGEGHPIVTSFNKSGVSEKGALVLVEKKTEVTSCIPGNTILIKADHVIKGQIFITIDQFDTKAAITLDEQGATDLIEIITDAINEI